MRKKICILTSVHPPYDTRVFHKQARGLARAGYEVVLASPHDADFVADGVRVRAIRRGGPKALRGLSAIFPLLRIAVEERADAYHLHDPEMLPLGLLLKLMGKRVVYDVHEYFLNKVQAASSIPAIVRPPLARLLDGFENLACRAFDGVIAVDSVIQDKFCGRAEKISNFPILPERLPEPTRDGKTFNCVYVGGLSHDRGLFKMVEAMEHVPPRVRLRIAGFRYERHKERVEAMPGFRNVEYLGRVEWPESIRLQSSSDVGLLLLQPTPQYVATGEGIQKLFEYMMNGLPVLCSDFPCIRRIIEREACGLTVDPTDPRAIAAKIAYLAENPDAARRMGERGRKAVRERYNWQNEEKKLLALYGRILGKT